MKAVVITSVDNGLKKIHYECYKFNPQSLDILILYIILVKINCLQKCPKFVKKKRCSANLDGYQKLKL